MDPRMGRRPGYHHQEESDIVSPHAARLHGGSRSGPRGQGYGQGYGQGSGGAGPSEVEAPRRSPYAGGRHHYDAEEAGFADARPAARRHNNVSGRPNRGNGGDRDFEHSEAFFDPIRQGPRDIRRAQGMSEDNERYGGSQREGGNRARERSEDDYGNPDPRPSRALVSGRSMRRDEKQDSRYVQYTFEMLDPASVDFLVQHWQVPTRHLKDWFDNSGLKILVGRENDNETNTKEIVAKLVSKYPKVYGKAVLGEENLGHIGYHGRATTGRRNRNPDYTHSSR